MLLDKMKGIKNTPALLVILPLLGLLSSIPFLLGAQSGNWEGSNVGDAQTVPTSAVTESIVILDTDNIAVATTGILEFLGLTTAPGGILSYDAEATYDGNLINILDPNGVRGGDVPFDAAPTQNIDNSTTGITTFTDTTATTSTQPPITLAKLVVVLVGCKNQPATLTVTINDVRSVDFPAESIPGDTVVKTFLRGDARADGNVNVADALFVAQYLAQLRSIGEDPVGGPYALTHPINGGSAKDDVGGNKVNVADALFIAQVLAVLRDECYILT